MKNHQLEKRLAMTFDELSNYIEFLLDDLNKIHRKETTPNKVEFYEESINILEEKIFDLVTIERKHEILKKYKTQFRQKKEDNSSYKEKELSNYIELLKLLKKDFKSSQTINELEKIYNKLRELPKDMIDLRKYETPFKSGKNCLFIDNSKSSQIKNTKRLNPNYKLDSKLKELYQVFVKEIPYIIAQAIEKIEERIVKQNINKPNRDSPEDLEERDKKILERTLNFESKGQITKRRELIVKLRRKKSEIFGYPYLGIPTKKLNWKFFPKGQWTVEAIIKDFSKFLTSNEKINEKRLRKIVDNLQPSFCYVSEEGFNRYIAFCFDERDKVILECPIYGNATYIIKGNWHEITRLPKWEARRLNQVTVITHNKNWFEQLKSNLKSPY